MKSVLFLCLLAGALCVETVPVAAVPTQSEQKVEVYVGNLRKDLESQEKDLGVFIAKAQQTKIVKEKRLKSLEPILSHLSEQLRNTTKYYNEYNKYVNDERQALRPFTVEFDRAMVLYNSTKSRLAEERFFLDTLTKYIKASIAFRSQCLK